MRSTAALALALLPLAASAWSTRDCSTNSSLQPTYPNGSVWPLVYQTNMPLGGWARSSVERAMFTWNSIVGATDNLSVGGGSFGFCQKPDNSGLGVIGWDDGSCYSWSTNEIGVCVLWTSNCTVVREAVYFNSARSFSSVELEHTALHELGHYQNADHDWYEVSIMGYGAPPIITLTAADHQFLRTVWSSSRTAPPDLYLDRNVLSSPVVPGQESFIESPPPTCSGGCSSIETGDTISVKLSYGNAGSTAVNRSFDIEMRLGTHVIGTWSLASYPAHGQDIYVFNATVPPGVPPGNYALTIEIDPDGLVSQVEGPTSGDSVTFTGFTVPAPPGWTCSLARYNALDGCDCGCGVADPDCTLTSVVARGCGDLNACTDDRCSSAGTCLYSNNTLTCDDGAYCTVTDRCSGGACAAGSPRDCSAQTSACSVGQCSDAQRTCLRVAQNEGQTCDDGRYCTVSDSCASGFCTGTARDCSALDSQCTVGACNESSDSCMAQPAREGQTCNDNALCTVTDTCRSGTCSGTVKNCSMLDGPCVRGQCDPTTGGCIAVPLADGASCEDGQFCTVGDTCSAGVCGAGSTRSCAAMDSACTLGTCSETARACQAAPRNEGGTCDDGKYCSTTDVCVAGVCRGAARDCSSLDGVCQRGACDESVRACKAQPGNEGGACDDGAFCTVADVCQGGACRGTARTCPATPGSCQVGRCDETGDACVMTTAADGATCDDGQFCTVSDHCTAGACSGGPRDCSALDSACAVGTCTEAAGACGTVPRPDGTTCDDGLGCTENDVCAAGACTAGPQSQCSAPADPCWTAVCQEPGQCVAQYVSTCAEPSSCGCSAGGESALMVAAFMLMLRGPRRRQRAQMFSGW